MKKNIIAVCDTDKEYACNFAEYLNSKKKLPFQAEAFTDVDKLCHYAGKNPPEILLISESDMDSQVEKLNTENMILLSDEKEKEGNHKYVYKYQSADSVIREVMEYYTQNAALFSMAARGLSIIGVYSPLGRCGKTLFALTAGQLLGEKKSVLYVSMEDYAGFEELFHQEYERNMSDLFYNIRCGEPKLLLYLQSMIQHFGKLDYIPPAASPEDMRDIRFEEWLKFFDLIRMGNSYEVLILDIGSSVDQLFKVLSLCSRIYMPVLEDRMSQCKITQFKKLIKQWEEGAEDNFLKEIHIPAGISDWSNPGLPETLVWGKFGGYVRKVLDSDERGKYTGK